MSGREAVSDLDGFDALESAAFGERMPGARAALDAERMQGQLVEQMLADGWHLEHCRIRYAIYRPRQACCNAIYRLDLRDPHGAAREHVVSGRVLRSARACERYAREQLAPLARAAAGHPALAAFGAPVATLASEGIALSAFPIDGDFPALLGALEAPRMQALFREALPPEAAGRVAGPLRAELVRYRANGRCMLRYEFGTAAGASTVLYGKVQQKPVSPDIARAMSALREIAQDPHAPYAFHVPRPIASADPHFQLAESIPGDPRRIRRLLRKRERNETLRPGRLSLLEAIGICARITAALHASEIRLGRLRSLAWDLRRLRRTLAQVTPFMPQLAPRLAAWLAKLEARAERSKPQALRFGHGDLNPTQFLFHGRQGGLVDFDAMSQAEPARDLGRFLAFMSVAAARADPAREPSLEALRESFLTAYLDASDGGSEDPGHVRERVELYEACTLLHRILKSWLKFDAARTRHGCALLERHVCTEGP